jgi:hypothetical protein
MFNKNNEETFYNLSKWHSDIVNYSSNQDNSLAIVLVSLKKKPQNNNRDQNSEFGNVVTLDMIEKFQKEKKFIVGYCEIDLNEANKLKEPFEILLGHINENKYAVTGSQLILNQHLNYKIEVQPSETTGTDETKCCKIT